MATTLVSEPRKSPTFLLLYPPNIQHTELRIHGVVFLIAKGALVVADTPSSEETITQSAPTETNDTHAPPITAPPDNPVYLSAPEVVLYILPRLRHRLHL
jgi:hypothetical protein